jgi:hypothetical protein
MKNKTIRWSTLIKKHGNPHEIRRSDLTPENASHCLTIHHDDDCADFGVPGVGFVNVSNYVLFNSPIPSSIDKVIGIKYQNICRQSNRNHS